MNSSPPCNKATLESAWAAKALWVLLGAYALVLPVGGTTAWRNLTFFSFFGVFAYISWRQCAKPWVPLPWAWLALTLPAVISFGYTVDLRYSLGEFKAEILMPFLLFSLIANVIREERDLWRLLRIMAMGGVFLVAFSLATAVGGGATKDGLVGTINTGVGYYSTYLVCLVPFLVLMAWHERQSERRRQAYAFGVLLLACLVSLVLTMNRQSLVAIAVMLLFAAVMLRFNMKRKHWVVVVLGVTIVGTVLVHQYMRRDVLAVSHLGQAIQADVRWPVWKQCLMELAEHPLTGGGFGLRTFQFQHPDLAAESPFWHAHNVILNKGMQMGVPGIVGFLILFLAVPAAMRVGLKAGGSIRAAAVAGISVSFGFLVKNLTDDFMYRESGYLFWLLAGAVIGFVHGQKEKIQKASTP